MQMLQNHADTQKSMGAYGGCVHPWGCMNIWGCMNVWGIQTWGNPDTPSIKTCLPLKSRKKTLFKAKFLHLKTGKNIREPPDCTGNELGMISWSSFALSGQVKGHACFCVPCWSVLVYISIFPSWTFASLSLLPFWGCVWILSACRYLYLLIS